MLTYAELVELDRSLRGSSVLSVYVDGRVVDPAQRSVWRRKLENDLTAIRESLEHAPHEVREAFEHCVRYLHEQLATVPGMVGASGWVAFITEQGVRYAEPVPAPVPSVTVWGTGIRAAPYIRALKQQRPVIVAMVDHRLAHLYRYRAGTLEMLETLRAHAHVGPIERMQGAAPSPFHPGVRGTTGADEADRVLRRGLDQLLAQLADRLVELAGDDGWIIIGGAPQPAAAAARALPSRLAARTQVMPSLHLGSTDAEIARGASRGASMLRGARDREHVAELIERAGADGLSTIGAETTLRALHERAVEALFLSERFVETHTDEAEAVIKEAFDQRAYIEAVTGTAAKRLDADARGIAARLRFTPYGAPGASAASLEGGRGA